MTHRMWRSLPLALAALVLPSPVTSASPRQVPLLHTTQPSPWTPPHAGAATSPGLLTEDFSTTFAVRPATLLPTGDGSIVIGKLGQRGHHVRWHYWYSSKAYGKATVWVDDGIPTVATGTFHGYRSSIHASRVRHGRFTRMTVRYRKSGKIRTWKLALKRLGTTGWTWRRAETGYARR